jgi:hypothetical protein
MSPYCLFFAFPDFGKAKNTQRKGKEKAKKRSIKTITGLKQFVPGFTLNRPTLLSVFGKKLSSITCFLDTRNMFPESPSHIRESGVVLLLHLL